MEINIKKIGFSILFIILSVFTAYSYIRLQTELNKNEKLENNIVSLSDSITITNNKIDQQVYNKTLLISDYQNLSAINADLSCELAKFKKKNKKNTAEIQKLNFNISILSDSLKTTYVGQIDSTLFEYNFNFADEFTNLEVSCLIKSEMKPFNVTSKLVKCELYSDIIIKKSTDNVLSVYSNNPYLKFNNIQGATLKPMKVYKKKYSIGIGTQLGYGVTKYGLAGYSGIGISFNYNILQW